MTRGKARSAPNRRLVGGNQANSRTSSPGSPRRAVSASYQKHHHPNRRKVASFSFGGWVRLGLTALIVVFLLRFFVFDVGVVDGDSMLPTLKNGEHVLLNKIGYSFSMPKRGDVVACYYPYRANTYIKRVVALPGDTVSITSGQLFVNGEPFNPAHNLDLSIVDMEPVTVPPESVFVLGDNRNHSLDSRNSSVGFISLRDVEGKAIAVAFPISEFHAIQ